MDGYRYAIGDVLVHRAALVEPPLPAARLFVVGRLTEERVGGVERSYLCRLVHESVLNSFGIGSELVRFYEHELVPLTG